VLQLFQELFEVVTRAQRINVGVFLHGLQAVGSVEKATALGMPQECHCASREALDQLLLFGRA
jgi:hypothetical protein